MLGDISQAEHIYIAYGRINMRRSIDGLAALVQQDFKLDPFSNSLFLFVEAGKTGSKPCIRKGMDSFSYISVWKTAASSGRGRRKKQDSSPDRKSVG